MNELKLMVGSTAGPKDWVYNDIISNIKGINMKNANRDPEKKSRKAGIIVSLNIFFSCSYNPGAKKAQVSLIIMGREVNNAR
ncbi:hypothetical protein J5U22_00406 [Saccharolobus shibatae]|uniref:Uncharacterized protein n=1 Tax=Saccharolobus shibatae TaxID=2286 RepID=A0A8F5BYP3_9CREN|nr:hypothetical protein J5U21_00475 [Saccharolobus shibatae]QXJ33861.1 hypothetical protein J5U22_00406 [Saccharolobus shibatae]